LLAVTLMLFASVSVAGEEGGAGEHHPNHLALFLGTTHAEGEDEFTVGVDFEHRLPKSRFFGVGGFVDHAGGALDSTIVAAAAFVHFPSKLRLQVAPGIGHAHGDNEPLVLIGLAYEFGWKRLSLSPEYSVDFVDGEQASVYGVAIGFGF